MRVTFEMPATGVGFFPGLAKPVVIEASQLDATAARELEGLVAAARFFDRPAMAEAPAARGADVRQFTVTIEENGRRRTLHVSEPIADPVLQRLVRFLEAQAKVSRAAGHGSKTP